VDPKAECDELNLAHETKTNELHCPQCRYQPRGWGRAAKGWYRRRARYRADM